MADESQHLQSRNLLAIIIIINHVEYLWFQDHVAFLLQALETIVSLASH